MQPNRMLAVLVLAVLLAGCSSGEPTRYYLVEATGAQPAQLSNDVAVDIIDLEIPQYLERSQIASRRQGSELVFASAHLWAENLRKNLLRALARNLTNALGTAAIGTPNNRLSAPADFRVLIYIERYERGPDGYVELVTRWQLINAASQKTIANESSTFRSDQKIDSKDYGGTVAAMSELLREFADTVAQRIPSDP